MLFRVARVDHMAAARHSWCIRTHESSSVMSHSQLLSLFPSFNRISSIRGDLSRRSIIPLKFEAVARHKKLSRDTQSSSRNISFTFDCLHISRSRWRGGTSRRNFFFFDDMKMSSSAHQRSERIKGKFYFSRRKTQQFICDNSSTSACARLPLWRGRDLIAKLVASSSSVDIYIHDRRAVAHTAQAQRTN